MTQILRFLFCHNARKWKLMLLLLLFCNLVLAAVTLLEPEILRTGVSAIQKQQPSDFYRTGVLAGVFVILLILAKSSVSLCGVFVQNGCTLSLQKKLMEKMVDTEKKSMDKMRFGDVSTIVIDNAKRCGENAIGALTDFTAGLGVIVLSLLYMAAVEWRLMIATVLYYCVVRLILVLLTRRMKRNASQSIKANKDGSNLLSSFLSNMIGIKTSPHPEFFHNHFRQRETLVMRFNWKRFIWSNGVQDFVWAAAKAAEYLIVYGVGALILGNVPLDTLFGFLFANDIFNNGLYQFSYYFEGKAEAFACMESMNEFLDNQSVESGGAAKFHDRAFAVRFNDVSFGYGEKPLLQKVSFTVLYGEKVLVRGGNGQGKSTLLKLLCGLYRPDSGKIYYGDVNTGAVHLNELFKVYSYISQESNLLDGDVYRNVALCEEYDEARIDKILTSLNMPSRKSLAPDRLSMGEKQRLNIARAFYKEPPVFVLADEIFANVDPQNRAFILEKFTKEFKDRTVFMITHEALDYPFDRVFTVERGQVTEERL